VALRVTARAQDDAVTAGKPLSGGMSTTQSGKLDYRGQKEQLLAGMLRAGITVRGVRSDLYRLAVLADRALRRLWKEAGFRGRCALVAVGGYGRRELYPQSDVDVLVLLPQGSRAATDRKLREQVENFVGRCWDHGLEIGSSVRTVEESMALAARDITVQTALLEARRVAGSHMLFAQLQQRFMQQLRPLDFFVAKRLEMRQRHIKHGDTAYALEPNCKESPGGLRDLQLILWVTRAAGLGTRWDDLQRAGLATAHEVQQLKYNEALLGQIRSRLHLLAGRGDDRLVFQQQIALAESFGLAHRLAPDGRVRMRASEILMRRYYWAAKAVVQLSQILLQVLEEYLRRKLREPLITLVPIGSRFLDREGRLEVVHDRLYQEHPDAILETFRVYAETPGTQGLSVRTLRALYNARRLMDPDFRRDARNHRTFLAILRNTGAVADTLQLMNETSVLGRYLWSFRRIVGQMQHDLYHAYTVDQHILTVLRNVERFFLPERAHEFPLGSQLAAGWDQPWLLYVAALFHDIAKGRGGNHSELGARDVRRFCRRHGVAGADQRLIEFLVREHLTMSWVAQKQDLSDPEVITAFASRVGDERRLTALYLLTVADIRGTSPKVWNAWKDKLLQDLYHLAARALGGWKPSTEALVEARKRAAWHKLVQAGYSEPRLLQIWNTLDVGYFMHHATSDIAWHIRELASQPHAAGHGDAPLPSTVARARRSSLAGGLQVFIYTRDQADLFARICRYFEGAAFSIVDARIHTTQGGWALDTFEITTALAAEFNRSLVSQIEAELPQAIIATDAALPEPRLGRGSPRVRSFPIVPKVEFSPDEKRQKWLLSVRASDRAGALYGIAWVLAQYDIGVEWAKIVTLGERIEDVFLVRGEPLHHPLLRLAIEKELSALLTVGS